MDKPKRLSSKIVYSTEYFQVVSDELEWDEGVVRNYSYAQANDGVCIVAIDDNQQVYLLEEFKYPIGKIVTTLPAGGIEDGETALTAAKRELAEEAGLEARAWTELGLFYPMAATVSFRGVCFLAQDLSEVKLRRDDTERITIKKVHFDTALKMASGGQVEDGWAMIALFLAEKQMESEGHDDTPEST